jgi:pimeloyl-ACP methyl ester carboxylesterase
MLEIAEQHPPTGTAVRRTPLMLVHGAFVAAWCWQRHWMDYLAGQGYRVIAPSLRGHGQSEGGDRLDHAGIREYVADLRAVVESRPGPAPVLVGHSMGALVVQRYLEQHPAAAAVLMAPIPREGLAGSTLRMMVAEPLMFAQFSLMQTFGSGLVDTDMARRAVFSDQVSDTEVAALTRKVQRESQRALWDMHVHADSRPWRVNPPVPVQVLAAGDDQLFRRSEVRSVAERWNAVYHCLEGMGHAMMLEPDWQAPADAMLGWLDGLGLD